MTAPTFDENEQLQGALAVAIAVMRIVHDILASNAPDAVERAKEGLAAFLEDQRLNGR